MVGMFVGPKSLHSRYFMVIDDDRKEWKECYSFASLIKKDYAPKKIIKRIVFLLMLN